MFYYLEKKYLWLALIFLLLFSSLYVSKCSDLEDSPDESLQNNNGISESGNMDFISMRPKDAVGIDFKKKSFDILRREVVVDKYYTKDGKKVKVILRRKTRPVFLKLRKWIKKRKAKQKAKKHYKEMKRKNKKKKKGFNLFGRFKKKKKNEDKSVDSSLNKDQSNIGNDLDLSEIFEGKSGNKDDNVELSDKKDEVLDNLEVLKESTNLNDLNSKKDQVLDNIEALEKITSLNDLTAKKDETINNLETSRESKELSSSNIKNTSAEKQGLSTNSLTSTKDSIQGSQVIEENKDFKDEELNSSKLTSNESVESQNQSASKENTNSENYLSNLNSHSLGELSNIDVSKNGKFSGSSILDSSHIKTLEESVYSFA